MALILGVQYVTPYVLRALPLPTCERVISQANAEVAHISTTGGSWARVVAYVQVSIRYGPGCCTQRDKGYWAHPPAERVGS